MPKKIGGTREQLPIELATDTKIHQNMRSGRGTNITPTSGDSKRTLEQREMDLIWEARLYLQGLPIAHIARTVSEGRSYELSYEMARFDIQMLLQRWQESYLLDFDAARSKELARIDQLEQAYWEGWERSKADKETNEVESIKDSSTSRKNVTVPTYNRSKAKKKTENQPGQAVFLNGIQWCIDKRCQILGLDSPKEISISWREQARKAGIDDGVLFSEMVRKYVDEAEKAGYKPVSQQTIAGQLVDVDE